MREGKYRRVWQALSLMVPLVMLFSSNPGRAQETESALKTTTEGKMLRVGFEVYAPFVVQNPNDQSVSGYSVDLTNRIADEAGWTVEWIKTAPDTKIVDLKAGKFDLVATPIYQTIARAREVAFTRPYVFDGDGSGLVRKGETRFQKISDLNQEGVIIAVRSGYTDELYARKHLPKATVQSMRVDDPNLVFLEVMSGKADIALSGTFQAKAFQAEHPEQTELRFVDPPTLMVPAGYIVRHGDVAMLNFLNTSLDILEMGGYLDQLARDHKVDVFKEVRQFKPASE